MFDLDIFIFNIIYYALCALIFYIGYILTKRISNQKNRILVRTLLFSITFSHTSFSPVENVETSYWEPVPSLFILIVFNSYVKAWFSGVISIVVSWAALYFIALFYLQRKRRIGKTTSD